MSFPSTTSPQVRKSPSLHGFGSIRQPVDKADLFISADGVLKDARDNLTEDVAHSAQLLQEISVFVVHRVKFLPGLGGRTGAHPGSA